jgi:hypothetical protein
MEELVWKSLWGESLEQGLLLDVDSVFLNKCVVKYS